MGWGEPHRPTHVDIPPSVWIAAQNLAARVQQWHESRSVVSEERMVGALAEWERAMAQPW